MKSKIILIENIDEITKAKEKNIDRAMDLPIPKEVQKTKELIQEIKKRFS